MLQQAASKGITSGKLWNLLLSSEPEAVNYSARSKEFKECRLKWPNSYQWLDQVTRMNLNAEWPYLNEMLCS